MALCFENDYPQNSHFTDLTMCPHDFIQDSVCSTCGMVIERQEIEDADFSKYHNRPKKSPVASLNKDIEKLNVNIDVKKWVQQKIGDAKIVYRQESRNKILFAYIYLGYLHLGKPFNYEDIAIEMGLTRSGIDVAIKIASGISGPSLRLPQSNINENITAPIVVISPKDILISLAQKLEMTREAIQEMVEILNKLIEASPIYLEDNPKYIAIGLIRYYYEIHNYKFTNVGKKLGVANCISKKYCEIFKLSL